MAWDLSPPMHHSDDGYGINGLNESPSITPSPPTLFLNSSPLPLLTQYCPEQKQQYPFCSNFKISLAGFSSQKLHLSTQINGDC